MRARAARFALVAWFTLAAAAHAQEPGTYPGGAAPTTPAPAADETPALEEGQRGLLDLGLSDLDLRLVSPDGRSLEIRLSGTFDTTWYGMDDEPSGMVTETHSFWDVRTSIFADVFIGERITGLVEFRADRGHAPADQEMLPRINQGFGRLLLPTPAASISHSVQVGIFATPFGNYIPRHDVWDAPLIRRPLPYDHRTSLQPDFMDQTFDNFAGKESGFIGWRDRLESQFRGEPLVWQEVYAGGAMWFGGVGTDLQWAFAVMNSMLGSTAYVWAEWPRRSRAWTFHGRVAGRPTFGTRVGASYAYGAWLPPDCERVLTREYTDFQQQAFGLDFEYTRGHVDTFAEVIYTTWETPIGTPGTGFHGALVASLGAYLESKVTLAIVDPALHVAGRVGYIWNSRLRSELSGSRRKWDRDQVRIEIGLGYRLGPETLVKLAYEMNGTMGNDPDDNALLFQGVLKV